jgi:phage terminase large subunit GpA
MAKQKTSGNEFIERIAAGLRRSSVKTPSRWAEQYRVMGKPIPGPWTLKYHPWLGEMHDTKAPSNVGKKSAQVGFSEMALNTVFFKIDVERENCLYVLPAKNPDATDFSASRFDPALELSSHLSKLFSDVQNVGHKRAGSANLYIRGSNSRAGLKSVPAGTIIFDEVDEMNQSNIPLAEERASGQFNKLDWKISTPTVPNFGIARAFNESTKEHFFFPCPKCNRLTELVFPDCMVITADNVHDPRIQESYIRCKECRNKLEHSEKHIFLASGRFVPEYTNRIIRGFYVNQLYSSTVSPPQIAKLYLAAQTDKTSETEFWNSKMGMEHQVDGAQLEDADIEKCIGNYKKFGSKTNGLITMGVDVGKWNHIEIDEWEIQKTVSNERVNEFARPRVLYEGKVASFNELDMFMRNFNVSFCVIDAQPERRLAFEFANRFWGKVKLCFYGRSISGRMINYSDEDTDQTIKVDRTSWLDLSLGRFRMGKRGILIPIDTSEEYKVQIKAPIRQYKKDAQGNPVGVYIEVGADHFAHARNYSEIALPLAVGLGQVHNILHVS